MIHRPSKLLLGSGGLLLAGIVASFAMGRGIVRVGAGRFALAGDRILPPGWHVVSPLLRPEILGAEGEGALPPVPVASREGVAGTALLRFRYRVDLPRLIRASAERRRGFHPLLEGAAASALHSVLGSRSAAEFLDHATLDEPVTSAVARALEEAGLRVSELQWEIRLPEDFRRNVLRSEYRSRARNTGIRILLIGLDGADWESIDPLLAAGRLPNIKRLIEAGTRGPLRSYNPMISPLLWTTAVTGRGPDVHGVADFSAMEAKTRKRIPISSRYRKVKAVWNILTDFGRPSAVVGWWATYPADRVDGYLVSDRVAYLSLLPQRASLALQPGYTFPSSYLSELLPRLATPRRIAFPDVRRFAVVTPEEYEKGIAWVERPPAPPRDRNEKPTPQDPVGLLIKILAAAWNYHATALDLLGRQRFDLMAVYYEGIDLVGHRFQHYRPPRMRMVDGSDYDKYRETVSGYYVYQDRLIGELLEKAGHGTTVLIHSDHGFKTAARRPEGILPYTVDQPVEWHREEGIFLLSGPAASRGKLQQPATLFDITPTILALLGLPVASDMPGHVLEEAIDPRFREKFPPAQVPTYEGVGAPRETEEAGGSDEVSAEMMAQLRALGYVGGDVPAGAPPAREDEAAAAESPAEETPVTYHRNLATYHLSRREYAPAIEQLQEANRRQKLPKTYAMLAEAYDALGRRSQALASLEEGWKSVPEGMEPESILWFVEMAVLEGDLRRGRRFLAAHERNLRSAPAVRDAAEGRLMEAAGNRQQAQRLYERALDADPTLVLATKQLVPLYRGQGRLESIRPILEAGLRKSDRIDEYHSLLGVLASEGGRREEALEHFRRAAELNPADSRFALNVGLTLMDLGRWRDAGEAFEKGIAAGPTADLYLGLGNVRLRTGDPAAALAAFQKAREPGGNTSRADLGIALSYLGLKRPGEALAFARESLSRHPEDPALRSLYQDLSRRR